MNRIVSVLALSSFFFNISATGLYPEMYDQSDSSKMNHVRLNEISVTGTRAESDLRELPMSVSRIDRERIENRFEQSLLPVLTEEVPGLFISSRGIMGYGVSNGAAGNMTIRGVGGSPTTGVLLLIDGHPQYMGLMGHPLADSYQSMMAERVEVIRGPASALYGSNASGGVINIITRNRPDGIHSRARLMYGSYNTITGEVDNSLKMGKFSSYVSLNYNSTDGHRDNMEFDEFGGYLKAGYEFDRNWKMNVDLNINKSKSSNPGPENNLVTDNDADISRGMTSFSLENKYDRTSGALKFFYNFGSHEINDGYRPQNGEGPLNKRFRSNDNFFGILLYQTYEFFQGNRVTAGVEFQRSGGHAWNKMIDGSPNEELVDEEIGDVAGYIDIRQNITKKLILSGGIRLDHNDNTGSEWIPQGALIYEPTGATTLKAIISKGFRNPTIRELYMFQPKNPDLRPERLVSYELSGSQKLFDNSLNFGLNIYYIKGSNTIQLTSVDGRSKFMNTGKIENYGSELDVRYVVSRNLSLSGNYSYLHMKHKVLVSPEHKAYFGATYMKDKWMISTGLQYIAGLYTVVQPTEEKESFLLWNLRASYKPAKMIELFVKGENLAARKYEINRGYPMPRATVFGGMNVTF